jgi:O-antigen ligase
LSLLATIVGGLLVAGLGGLVAAARANPRIGRVFDLNYADISRSERVSWPYALANRLEAGERLVFWAASLRNFSQSPLLGVGLGVSGFTFSRNLPGLGFYLPEILDNLDPGLRAFPNPKSLWIRLLAETGALGFAAFVIWLVCLASRARWLQRDTTPWLQAVGTAGALYLVVLVFEGFSLDTFALPQLWLIPGLLTAASAASRLGTSGPPGRARSGV